MIYLNRPHRLSRSLRAGGFSCGQCVYAQTQSLVARLSHACGIRGAGAGPTGQRFEYPLNFTILVSKIVGSRQSLCQEEMNEPAIQFYKRQGMTLVAIHHNALDESRKLKPEIPQMGLGGKPLRDEIEFEFRL